MSTEDVNLTPEGVDDDPLWACWYGGPARTDGGPRRRLQLTRDRGELVSLSAEEVSRLFGFIVAGVNQ